MQFPHHTFDTTPFWEPFCTLCHEGEEHPAHTESSGAEICTGYRTCKTCRGGDLAPKDRGV